MSGSAPGEPLLDVLARCHSELAAAGVPAPAVDAAALVGHVLSLDPTGVQAASVAGTRVSAENVVAVGHLVRRRAAREPLPHLLGHIRFRGLDLAVGPGVFVPRPETEQMVQLAVDALAAIATRSPIGVDLGTGSGAIALTLATEVPQATVYGVEVSPDAFVWTERNFRDTGAGNAHPVLADLADALPGLGGSVDVVMSNPPYIPLGMVPREPEVRLHDPAIALYGGSDGMAVLRQVSTTARRLLRRGGLLVVEHGEQQAAQAASLLTGDGWNTVAAHRDASGRDRATTARR